MLIIDVPVFTGIVSAYFTASLVLAMYCAALTTPFLSGRKSNIRSAISLATLKLATNHNKRFGHKSDSLLNYSAVWEAFT
jgi:hypothetical protein